MTERFNQTLMNMLGTLDEEKKSDWKTYVPALVHSYNATRHESTGFTPFYLMFGRHPRLPVDAFLGFDLGQGQATCTQSANDLKKRLQFAYDIASKESRRAGQRHKNHYDKRVRESFLKPNDRVLVRLVGLTGRNKLANKWGKDIYVVVKQPNKDIPVYTLKQESGQGPVKTLHRNMLLPLESVSLHQDTPSTERHQSGRSKKSVSLRVKEFQETSDRSEEDSQDDEDILLLPRLRSQARAMDAIPSAGPATPTQHSGSSARHPEPAASPVISPVSTSTTGSSTSTSSSSAPVEPEDATGSPAVTVEPASPAQVDTLLSGRPTRHRTRPAWMQSDQWVTNFGAVVRQERVEEEVFV